MAMNDELDDLVSLYTSAARETPSTLVDARILRAADRAASARRVMRHMAWSGALAAAVLLWFAFRGASTPTVYQPTPHDLQLTAELAQLHVPGGESDVTHYLSSQADAGRDPRSLENQP